MRTKMMVVLAALLTLGLTVGGLAPAASASPVRKAKPYGVTLTALPAKAQVGQALTLAGRVSGPDSARRSVTIQRRQGTGAWVTAATARTTKRGAFSVKVALVKGGTTSFRAVKARSKKRSQGISAVRSLAVYRWLDMAAQPHVAYGILAIGTDVRMGGRTYPRSVFTEASIPGSMVGVATAGLCTEMEAYSGFLDRDLPKLGLGAQQTLELVANGGSGEQATTFETPPGPVLRRAADITGSSIALVRLSVDSGDDATGTASAVVGTPRVLCNADELPSFPEDMSLGGP